MQGLRAVHPGHALIHQDRVILFPVRQRQRVRAAGGRVYLDFRLFQQMNDHVQIHLRVVHNQDAGIRRAEGLPIGFRFLHAGLEAFLIIPDRRIVLDSLRDHNRKDRADAVGAPDGYAAAHHVQQPLCNDQPEPGALHGAVALHIKALEAGKQLSLVLWPNPDARVLHGSRQDQPPVSLPFPANRQPNASLLRVLDGIAEDVRQNLPDPHLVAAQTVRERFVHVHDERKPLVLRLEKEHIAQIVEDGTELVDCLLQFDAPRLDLGKIENVVDDGQQVMAGVLHVLRVDADVLERFPHRRRAVLGAGLRPAVLPQNHLVHPQHRVDGGADLVGHVRQKVALRTVGAFGPHLFFHQPGLHLHKRPYGHHGKHGRHQQRQQQDGKVAGHGGERLRGQLGFKPFG